MYPRHGFWYKVGFGRRFFLEKGSVFSQKPLSREFREFRSKILESLENPRTVENKGEPDHCVEILENFRDSRDSSSEKTPFEMTPFSGADKGTSFGFANPNMAVIGI